MNLNSNCSVRANVRFEILTDMEADLKAQFLELIELRERLKEAQLSRPSAGPKARARCYRRRLLACAASSRCRSFFRLILRRRFMAARLG
jgi:hypothetical protein